MEWLDKLALEEASTIIVEGKKDTKALFDLGVTSRIVEVNQGKNIFDLISDLKEPGMKLIILTDWDRKGGFLAQRIEKACLRADIPYDTDLRREISIITIKWIKAVESIPNFLSHLEEG